MEKSKYGFDLDWFLSSCSYRDHEKMNYHYDRYYLDYKKFVPYARLTIQKIQTLLSIFI